MLCPGCNHVCFSCPARRFASESFLTGASSTQLSTKLLSLLQDCICAYLLPDLQRRLEKLKGAAVTSSSRMLLKKGRRCVGLPVVCLYCHCPLFCLRHDSCVIMSRLTQAQHGVPATH